jgi:hypothetical protein
MATATGDIVRVQRNEFRDILFRCVTKISSSVATVTTVRAPSNANNRLGETILIHVAGLRAKAI